MKKKSFLKSATFVLLTGIAISVAIAGYLFFKPHRDVQASDAFAELSAKELTDEFAANETAANAKYLSTDGNSKILVVKGFVNKVSVNQKGEKVIELKDPGSKLGITASFIKTSTADLARLQKGDPVKIKGAITVGNSYDSSLDLYNNAVLVQCDIVK